MFFKNCNLRKHDKLLKLVFVRMFVNFISRLLLRSSSKIQIYEGAPRSEVDDASHNAAKAICNLVSKLTEKDLLIVLCSG